MAKRFVGPNSEAQVVKWEMVVEDGEVKLVANDDIKVSIEADGEVTIYKSDLAAVLGLRVQDIKMDIR